jgi:hypothetical protein
MYGTSAKKRVTPKDVRREAKRVEEKMVIRLDASDRAMELARAEITRVPTELDKRILSTERLFGQQIKTLEERIGQQAALLANAEANLNEKTSYLTTRMAEISAISIGRSQISGPMWGIIGSVLATVMAAAIILLVNIKEPSSCSSTPKTELSTAH